MIQDQELERTLYFTVTFGEVTEIWCLIEVKIRCMTARSVLHCGIQGVGQ